MARIRVDERLIEHPFVVDSPGSIAAYHLPGILPPGERPPVVLPCGVSGLETNRIHPGVHDGPSTRQGDVFGAVLGVSAL